MTVKSKSAQDYTLVVGLGVTGLSVVRFMTSLGERVKVVDSRDFPPSLETLRQEFPDIEYETGRFDTETFTAARRLVVSPGVVLSEAAIRAAIDKGVEVISDLDLFANVVAAPVIGITGSNGKSTVTTLLGEMAKQANVQVAVGGNIGTPALDLLDDDVNLYVLELSSFQLELVDRLPMVASVVLNISPDHLDRHEDLAHYALCKQKIYQLTKYAVINLDDELASGDLNLHTDDSRKVVAFTSDVPDGGQFGIRSRADGSRWLCLGDEELIATGDLKIKGLHNELNALAALAVGQCVGFPMGVMLDVLRKFSGLPHRMQWVAEAQGVNWYNDSKATNIGAAIAAITGLPGTHILIAGGDGKGADFSALAESVRGRLRKVILIGKDADQIHDALKDQVVCEFAEDMAIAVRLAKQAACPGDNVLLSPACASLDMYKNFEERGHDFSRNVRELLS